MLGTGGWAFRLFVLAVLSVISFASASDSLDLECVGESGLFLHGFGVGDPMMAQATRTVRIDLQRRVMVTDTLFGRRESVELEIAEEKFKARISHGFEHKETGVLVLGEEFSINRFTGVGFSRYILSSDTPGRGFAAFVGDCKRAERRF